jgi:hypothetical protein
VDRVSLFKQFAGGPLDAGIGPLPGRFPGLPLRGAIVADRLEHVAVVWVPPRLL